MELADARPGAAIELPEGLYALAALTHCRATALEWLIFELAADEGTVPEGPTQSPAGGCPQCPTLALVAGQLHTATVAEADALPEADELTVNHMIYHLRSHGEARGERSSSDGHTDFWLGQYRHYEREGRVLIFMDVRGRIQRLTGEPMDARLIRVY